MPTLPDGSKDDGLYWARAVLNTVPRESRWLFYLYTSIEMVPTIAAIGVLLSILDPRAINHYLVIFAAAVSLLVIAVAEGVAAATSDAAQQSVGRPARVALFLLSWLAVLISSVGMAAIGTGSIVLSLTWSWPPGRFLVSITLVILSVWSIFSYASATDGPRRSLVSGRGAAPLYANYSRGAADKLAVGHALGAIIAMVTRSAAGFAVVTHALLSLTGSSLNNADGSLANPEPAQLMGFYVWRLVNALPGSPLETLQFTEPYSYTAHWIGVVVLLYFLAVATPAVAFLRELVVWRRDLRPTDACGAESSGDV